MVLEKLYSQMQKNETWSLPSHHTKINSKQIKYLKVEGEL